MPDYFILGHESVTIVIKMYEYALSQFSKVHFIIVLDLFTFLSGFYPLRVHMFRVYRLHM